MYYNIYNDKDNESYSEFVYSRSIVDKYFFKLLLNYLETKKNYQLNFSKLELIED